MDGIQKVSFGLFAAAWVVLAAGALWSLWSFSGFTFLVLLLLSGVTFAVGFSNRRMRLQRRGKLLIDFAVVSSLLLFLAPAVQTLPNGQSTGSICNGNGCSDVVQFESVTDYFWCIGAFYQYSAPPVVDLQFYVFWGNCPPSGPFNAGRM